LGLHLIAPRTIGLAGYNGPLTLVQCFSTFSGTFATILITHGTHGGIAEDLYQGALMVEARRLGRRGLQGSAVSAEAPPAVCNCILDAPRAQKTRLLTTKLSLSFHSRFDSAEPLDRIGETLMFRGSPVEKHCPVHSTVSPILGCIINCNRFFSV